MKVKKKGRVYPSLSSSLASYKDPNSVFKLLPVAILALTSALPTPDQQVLAYMITRSIISTSNPSVPKSKYCKKGKVPVFQCGCFDCYTRFWKKWDSSPNRDLIHQAIEAFEDHLMQNEVPKKRCKAARKKDKVKTTLAICESNNVVSDNVGLQSVVESDEGLEMELELELEEAEKRGGCEQEGEGNVAVEMEMPVAVSHKGLARKVLPDVVGLFNSRLWSLWGPSM